MLFVTLVKVRGRITKDKMERVDSLVSKSNVKVQSFLWTLGRYDAVITWNAPDEKSIIELAAQLGDIFATETMVGVESLPTSVL